MSDKKADTVPGLGFKDNEKALETIKILENRDPDYQKLAIKGLIGRAKRVLTLTKDEQKLINIKAAIATFDEWLKNFDENNLIKQNRPYLSVGTVKTFIPLKTRLNLKNSLADDFLQAYEQVAKGEYKSLRTIAGKEGDVTWDIIRNLEIKKILDEDDDNEDDLWEEELPNERHLKLILWAYSPEANKIKKNIEKIQGLLGKDKAKKREVENDSTSDEESPKKKSKSK